MFNNFDNFPFDSLDGRALSLQPSSKLNTRAYRDGESEDWIIQDVKVEGDTISLECVKDETYFTFRVDTKASGASWKSTGNDLILQGIVLGRERCMTAIISGA